jgi:hypothetical protein
MAEHRFYIIQHITNHFIFSGAHSMVKMPEVKKIAGHHGIKPGRMKKVELVRAIQDAEGNYLCYATDRIEECPEVACLWREDCAKDFAKA